MTKNELKKIFESKGLESIWLDDLTHDAASQLASNANNDGFDGQINFLTEVCGWSLEDIFKRAEEEL